MRKICIYTLIGLCLASGTYGASITIVDLPATDTDAAIGIDPNKTYTHAIDLGENAPTVINGVAFDQGPTDHLVGPDLPYVGVSSQGYGYIIDDTRATESKKIRLNAGNDNVNSVADGNSAELLRDMIYYSGGSPANEGIIVTLQDLVPGGKYSVRWYYRQWDTTTERPITVNAAGVEPIGIDIDGPGAHYLDYTFVADGNDVTMTFITGITGEGPHIYGLTCEVVAPKANIIWVSDNAKYDFDADQPADAGFVDLLRAEGYNVDYKGEAWPYDPNDDNIILNPDWKYWQTLDTNKIDELNAADLVIISRIADSGKYDDKPDAVTGLDECIGWNSVTTPMISMSAHLARSGYGKWGWHNTSGHPYTKDNVHNILDPYHAIFAGIEVDPNGQADLLTDEYTVNGSDPADADAGNGVTLATRASDNAIMISYWDAGLEYFDGAGYFAGGPRMFFAAGSGNESPRDGIYNLTADGETVFLNAVEYMLPSPVGLGADAAYSLDTSAVIAGEAGSGFTSLDGTWNHDNNSDQWDGMGIGEGNPGGVSAIDGYLRIQETGDPREHGFPDPGSNRKIYMVHDMASDMDPNAAATILDDGVTLFFRMRLATDGLLDQIHPDGGGDIVDVPATGDGYLIHDAGTGSIGIMQAAGGQISFTLTTVEENEVESGLHMNNLNGAIVSGDVDWNEQGTLNLLPLDPTVWHDFWVTIQADASGVGTHQVDVSVDGAPA